MIYRRLFDVPTWRFRSSFDELAQMRRQMERLFEDVQTPRQRSAAGVFPLINLTEDKSNFYVRAELPGVKGDALDIQATANNLSISGERQIVAEEGVRYHRRERESGSFSRIIGLPAEVDTDKVEAKLQDGVLTVVVPKAEIAKPKQISVNS
jgi:HSP20 family protein